MANLEVFLLVVVVDGSEENEEDGEGSCLRAPAYNFPHFSSASTAARRNRSRRSHNRVTRASQPAGRASAPLVMGTPAQKGNLVCLNADQVRPPCKLVLFLSSSALTHQRIPARKSTTTASERVIISRGKSDAELSTHWPEQLPSTFVSSSTACFSSSTGTECVPYSAQG